MITEGHARARARASERQPALFMRAARFAPRDSSSAISACGRRAPRVAVILTNCGQKKERENAFASAFARRARARVSLAPTSAQKQPAGVQKNCARPKKFCFCARAFCVKMRLAFVRSDERRRRRRRNSWTSLVLRVCRRLRWRRLRRRRRARG